MKQIFSIITIITAVLLVFTYSSCKKTGFITSADALLRTSTDTLHFDTVFTSVGSTTQLFKIFNQNDQKLKLSSVQLMGGSTSFFSMNVDGLAGNTFNDVEIDANDSLYVFVKVTINPNAANLPFIVQDSIKISWNGNTRFVQLDAFGLNAHFLRGRRVTQDTTWNNTRPFVILDGLTVDENRTLTIAKGTKVYFHNNAPLIVNGTLRAIGNRWDSTRIIFRGNRLDEPYKNFPGSWPGIYFGNNSKDNIMQFCHVLNAYQGLVVQNPSVNANPKLRLNECVLDNIYAEALLAGNTHVIARNCLISNAGFNVVIIGGGTYDFNHCTMSSYANTYLNHKNPVFTVSNVAGTSTNILNCTVRNSIIYGEGGIVEDEIAVTKQGSTAFTLNFINVLYKAKNTIANAVFTNALKENPQFDSINTGSRFFNFRLRPSSPCINKAIASGITYDLDSTLRPLGAGFDIGCYEKQ